ncbi:hypothetical protein Q0590_32605 [Rhodocytophaga aerolata]|uniref:ParA family protein n=1 Tax=Rhodocytophaga aerolata TaxID=455078 RepID=A0ABT8RH77_9BACT|nr:hypothetical protein [Rhodocytophaga aerolata]MDO1451061.1 hypothetical protein [Rhodocytophaga aerolata]
MKKKQLIFITQAKGGSGKSILTFLLAEKFRKATIIEMDDATKTTTIYLAYRNPIRVTFLNKRKQIDRALFNDFLEEIAQSEDELFICDLGAAISEQLPFYLIEENEILPELLEALNLEIIFLIVVGGGNIFSQTFSYLKELHKVAGPTVPMYVMKNGHFDFDQEQEELLEAYTSAKKLPVHYYNITEDKNDPAQNRVKEVLKSGLGIDAAITYSKILFQKAINRLNISFDNLL